MSTCSRAARVPLTEVIDNYLEGQKVHEFDVFSGLLEQYASVERLFSGRSSRDEEVILKLRDENKEDIFKVIQVVLSHSRIGAKNNLILAILEEYKPNKPNAGNVAKYFRPALRKLTELESRQTAKVSLKAREVLIQCALPSLEERAAQMEHILRSSVVESKIRRDWMGAPRTRYRGSQGGCGLQVHRLRCPSNLLWTSRSLGFSCCP